MKVAVTYENGEVFPHFGRTPAFKIYEIEDNKVISSEVVDTNGTGHGALVGFIKNLGASELICGGIGGGAISFLSDENIGVFAGASGNTDEVINAYIAGSLEQTAEATCDHHGHGDGEHHSCGDGGCH
ncbi:MAG: dinitrogenase iron-molybdenum cofactor biosynthesis protein [Lachnospiraceae bacterium]|nr:dinitrogenase iron-molybdenum cofactor biosynthesis protein [Lachnospiraceae bacterium]